MNSKRDLCMRRQSQCLMLCIHHREDVIHLKNNDIFHIADVKFFLGYGQLFNTFSAAQWHSEARFHTKSLQKSLMEKT